MKTTRREFIKCIGSLAGALLIGSLWPFRPKELENIKSQCSWEHPTSKTYIRGRYWVYVCRNGIEYWEFRSPEYDKLGAVRVYRCPNSKVLYGYHRRDCSITKKQAQAAIDFSIENNLFGLSDSRLTETTLWVADSIGKF